MTLPGLIPMRSFRVLVVTNLWPYEGDPSYGCFVKAQMDSLRSHGVEFEVLFINGRESKLNYFRALPRLHRFLREKRFDLIHAHMGLAGWVARCQLHVPVVVSFLGNDVLGKYTRVGRVTLYDRFLMVSSFVLARLVRAVIVKSAEMKRKLRLDSARVIPNGVDLELFSPRDRDEARRALGLPLEKKYVLFPYRPSETRKRFDLAKAAVDLARQQIPQLEILQVSGVPQEQMPTYMNAADMLVMTSESEGSPNAVKEALALNLPVIAVDVGDTQELLQSTSGNYLVPREASAIAERIVEVCGSGRRSQSRERMSQLSLESVAERIVKVYAALA